MQYSDSQLYTQMLYFERLFSAKDIAGDEAQKMQPYISTLSQLGELVEQYMNTSARRWVDLGQIFSFATAFNSAKLIKEE